MYKDINGRSKYYFGFRLMYGLTKNLTVMTTIGASNHHFQSIPPNGFVNYITNHHQKGYPVPKFLPEGINVYAKYRLINFDGEQRHLRIAAYAEATKGFLAHTEGESNLMTDNTGYGGGLIFTRLYKRFAASVTWGFIKSAPYKQSDHFTSIIFKSGDVQMYNVSFGYRLYPKKYDSYKDVNVNLYAEFINRTYGAAKITYDGLPYNYDYLKGTVQYTYNSFLANKYSELRSSVQFIFNSNSRLDIGVAVPVYHRSYLYDYPLVYINVQKYLFR
ncbi:MAG TPA: hypothetical protein VNB90_08555 [Cytophagaceae bacterium]|nr:hypothetical protein [Cytophagaceae bacterium]